MRTHLAFPLLLALGAIACTNNDPSPAPVQPEGECSDANTPGCVVASAKQRVMNPSVSDADLGELVHGNTAFALGLYQELRGTAGNLFYSPHSMSIALGMTWAGARGETEQKMAEALHFSLPQDRLHPAFNALDLELASRGQGADGADGQGFRLNIANALWGQVGYSFATPFLDTLGVNYGAGMHVVNFVEQADQSRGIINDWVAERTEDRIQEILPQGSITSDTRLVLTNAIYFNAAWETPFEESSTAPGSFTTQAGSSVTVDMMSGVLDTNYGAGNGFTAAELPYDGHELSMVVVLPEDLDAFEADLDAAKLESVVGSLTRHIVTLSMPKFEFESDLDLKDPLSAMGMDVAFSGDADFSGINGTGGLYISDVLHKAFVSVNEAGTEAAASTAVVVGETSAPEPASISLDKPFLFFIRDLKTDSVLFFGRVSDPSAE